MTSSADIYGIIPRKEGGYVLAKTKFADGVERVDTDTLIRMMRKDHSLHFLTFAFEEVDMMHEYFKDDGTLASKVAKHLAPIAVFGSIHTKKNVSIMLDGNDFKKFEPQMVTSDAFFGGCFCMEGLKSIPAEYGECWHTKLEVVK